VEVAVFRFKFGLWSKFRFWFEFSPFLNLLPFGLTMLKALFGFLLGLLLLLKPPCFFIFLFYSPLSLLSTILLLKVFL